jgi:hypothetical protein
MFVLNDGPARLNECNLTKFSFVFALSFRSFLLTAGHVRGFGGRAAGTISEQT